MYKKILSCLCIGIIFISILNPLKIKAYSTDLDNYVDTNLTPEQMEDAIGSSIIGYLLGAGAEFLVPGSGQTVQGLYDQINEIIDESVNIKNNIVSWIQDKQVRFENPHLWLPMYWDNIYSYEVDKGPIADAANYYIQRMAEINEDNAQPDIPVNYLPYIELINGSSFNYQWFLSDNWFLSCQSYDYSTYVINGNPANYSYIIYDTYISGGSNANKFRSLNEWNNNSKKYIATFDSNNQRYKGYFLFYNPINIYINQVNNVWQCTTSSLTYNPLYKHSNNNNPIYGTALSYDSINHTVTAFAPLNNPVRNVSWQANADTLEDCLKLVAMNFRNVNIYINGEPWSTINPPPDPINVGGHTYLTNTDIPVEFKFPEGTLNDLALIKSILHQLIDLNNTGNAITIQIDDILEAFTDEYGQQAMYVVVVHRNDYDQLIYEQYPYNVIVNKVHGLTFPENQINGYVDEMTYITKTAGSDLIPNDILVILGAGGVLLLIAFLINRLLE